MLKLIILEAPLLYCYVSYHHQIKTISSSGKSHGRWGNQIINNKKDLTWGKLQKWLPYHCPIWHESQNKSQNWPLFTNFALLSCCIQMCWTQVFWLSVVPTGFWMTPLASVSVKTDSPKTAVAQAGNWTTKPVRKASDISKNSYLNW